MKGNPLLPTEIAVFVNNWSIRFKWSWNLQRFQTHQFLGRRKTILVDPWDPLIERFYCCVSSFKVWYVFVFPHLIYLEFARLQSVQHLEVLCMCLRNKNTLNSDSICRLNETYQSRQKTTRIFNMLGQSFKWAINWAENVASSRGGDCFNVVTVGASLLSISHTFELKHRTKMNRNTLKEI